MHRIVVQSRSKGTAILQPPTEARMAGGLSSFALHIIAMASMLIDHVLLNSTGMLAVIACIGRIAAPLFCFMLAEGFFHTKNLGKYIGRIALAAVLSEIPHDLLFYGKLFDNQGQNVMFSLFLILCMMAAYRLIAQRARYPEAKAILYAGVFIVGVLLGAYFAVDSVFGIIVGTMFYALHDDGQLPCGKKILYRCLQVVIMVVLSSTIAAHKVLITFDLFGTTFTIYEQVVSVLALPLIWAYNRQQGLYNKTIRCIYYLFYPLHMLILAVTGTF